MAAMNKIDYNGEDRLWCVVVTPPSGVEPSRWTYKQKSSARSRYLRAVAEWPQGTKVELLEVRCESDRASVVDG